MIRRFVKLGVLEVIGEVLLDHVVTRIIVGVLVVFAVAHVAGQACAGVA